MATNFSMADWEIQKEPIALHQAFGITPARGEFVAPKLTASLPAATGQAQHEKSLEQAVANQQKGQQKKRNKRLHVGNPNADTTDAENQALGQRMVARAGWTGQQWVDFNNVVMAESGWSTTAANPSGAYGIPQALPGSKMASAGSDWQTNPRTQIRWMIGYIRDRYGNPSNAWAFHLANGWY